MNGGEEEAGTLCAAVFAVRGWFTLQLLHNSGLGREGSALLGPESSGPCLESCRSPSPGSIPWLIHGGVGWVLTITLYFSFNLPSTAS